MTAPSKIRVFIGSSHEAELIGRNLQAELQRLRPNVEVTLWSQGIFEAGDFTLERLEKVTRVTDFAVVVTTPDDTVVREDSDPTSVPRDNVIFELGLFIGAIGRDRTYIVADLTRGEIKLPTDLDGVTHLPYRERSDGNQLAAVNDPVLALLRRIDKMGPLASKSSGKTGNATREAALLDAELDAICNAAEAQGWFVKTRTPTVLRLLPPRRGRIGRTARFSFSITEPSTARKRLRAFTKRLRGAGLRLSSAVRSPPDLTPW